MSKNNKNERMTTNTSIPIKIWTNFIHKYILIIIEGTVGTRIYFTVKDIPGASELILLIVRYCYRSLKQP